MIARILKVTGLATLSIGLALALVAQTAPPPAPSTAVAPGNPMAACRADVKALCATVERGKGAKMQCLVENKAKASLECQAAMLAIQERMAKGEKRRLAECRADVATLCATAAKGAERVQCLRQNEAKVSPACSQALAAMPVRKRGAAPAPAASSNPPPATPDAPKPQ